MSSFLRIVLIVLVTAMFFRCEEATVEPEVDDRVPEILQVRPPNGATDVSVNENVSAEFSEKLRSISMSISADTTVPATLDSNGTTISLKPDSSLSYGTEYVVTIHEAEDMAGNVLEGFSWRFTTEKAPDTSGPTVVETSPEADEEDATVFDFVYVKMDEPVDTNSVDPENLWVENSRGEVDTSESVEFDSETEIRFLFSESLASATSYTVHLSGIVDMAGNVMDPYSWQFTASPWTVGRKYDKNNVSYFDAGPNGVYFAGLFYLGNRYNSYFTGKFNQSGELEWLEEMSGKTSVDHDGTILIFLESENAVYTFVEKDYVHYLEKRNSDNGELIGSFEVPGLDNLIDHSIPVNLLKDGDGNIYVLGFEEFNFGTRLKVIKVDGNGTVLKTMVDPSGTRGKRVVTNGTEFFGMVGETTSSLTKLDDNFEAQSVWTPDGEFGFANIAISEGSNTLFLTGREGNVPTVVLMDASSMEVTNKVSFGSVYEEYVPDGIVAAGNNLYVLVTKPEGAFLIKLNESGEIWRTEIYFDIPSMFASGIEVSEGLGMVFVPGWRSAPAIHSTETGERLY